MPGGDSYAEMIDALRGFLDRAAGAKPDAPVLAALTADLRGWSGRLEAFAVKESEQIYARRRDLAGRGQVTSPAIAFTRLAPDLVEGQVTFSRYFLGKNGVAHGGAVLFVFDEIAGWLANLAKRPMSRTAYLRASFRSVAPIGAELTVSARTIREEGRKLFIHIELRHGIELCAEAEALMIALLPGQQ